MRNFYWLLLLFLSFILTACTDDDAPTPDIVAPQIAVHSPHADSTYLSIGNVILDVSIKGSAGIEEIRLFMIDPDGESLRVNDVDIEYTGNATERRIADVIKPGGAISGRYSLLIEAEDQHQNVASTSIPINIVAGDLATISYKTAFTSTGWFESVSGDFSSLDAQRFKGAFYSIIYNHPDQWGTPIEPADVDAFGEDFGGYTQLWSKWNTKNDSYLDDSEFEKGFADFKFFEQWDTDQDDLISEGELADGVGVLWDVNKDNMVTADEFETKLLKYFLR